MRVADLSASGGLKGRSFWALIVTQFLGAFNDNAFRMTVLLFVSAGMVQSKGGAVYTSGSTATFAVAYILFSAWAGYLADRFSKRWIIVLSKVAEILVMGLAFFALLTSDRATPILVLLCMAVQSTFFSPAKYGILPEILDDEELSQGNGLMHMTTYIAIILGTVTAGWLMALFGEFVEVEGRSVYRGALENAALVFVGIAALGTITSVFVGKVPASGSRKTFRWNFLADSWAGVQRVRKDRPLFLSMLANMYVWTFGAVFIQNFAPYGWEVLKAEQPEVISNLTGLLCVGIAFGSLAAGKLSGRKIEFGLVPFGAIGMTLCSIAYAFTCLPSDPTLRIWLTGINQVVLGTFVGFFVVPLNAYIQQKSPSNVRGDNIAVLNFITFVGVLLGALGVYILADVMKVNPAGIFVAFGLLTITVTIAICRALPDFLVRFVVWLLTHTVYRFRVLRAEHVPGEGPALLVCNHVSLADAALVTACLQRPVRFVMYREYYEHPLLHWAAKMNRAIPISASDKPSEMAEALETARRALVEDGALVCIFAEGSITRTGNLLRFRRGFERIVKDTDVPVIPVHLDRVWGSIFSFKGGRVFWKWPRAIPYPVTVSFGEPMPAGASAYEVRMRVAELGAEAFEHRTGAQVLLHHAFIRAAKVMWRKPCVADSTGARLRYGELLVAAALLGRKIRRLAEDDEHVGLLLPSSVGGVVANVATLFAGKVPVNLNYTASAEAVRSAVEDCEIRRILTSRAFVEKANVPMMPEMVMLEDLRADITPCQKVRAALAALLLPTEVVCWRNTRRGLEPNDPATVIFSSGTTGRPKGVLLSHKNLASDIEGFCQVMDLSQDACLCGILPFFHAFGFTATLWAPVLRAFRAVYHPNPLDARTIGRLVRTHRATHLITTPTFLATYTRKCKPGDFASLRIVVVGAEKLQPETADRFEETFGLRPLEGYGCTELGPVVAVNVPDVPVGEDRVQVGTKEGTIGQPLPNVAARVVDLETGETLPPGEEGLLLIKGPNVMLGYLHQPEKTDEVLQDGWYRTGDVARIDEDGFITITDRLSRFSKIGGEMVPHVAVEDAIHDIVGTSDGEPRCVVTSLPDERRGEQLAVLYTDLPVSVDELREKLNESDLPKLWIPKKDKFHKIDEIPLLGSGKTDLAKVRKIAADVWAEDQKDDEEG
jgi:acyl-[acyl-carrier-protein]-phospholipid O-acyltransferase/long-chain-fatty-acid--[acyl-carrier-protein] ligase